MTWFRVGGAGIPATLKNAMNAVFNKKFGTSGQNYPPKQWPDDVNLLGPLPIVVSNKAPIVSFNDGADDVPISKGTFYIVPKQSGTGTPSPTNPRAISGSSHMTINQTGKNLLEWSNTSQTINQVSFTVNSNGTITVNGTATSGDASFYATASTYYPLKAGTYKISGCPSGGSNTTYFMNETTKGATDTGTGVTLTLTEDSNIRIRITIRSGFNADNLIFQPMIEIGSIVTSFEAYKAKTPIVVSFGQTVYGGEYDTQTGVLKLTDVVKTFTGGSSENWGEYSNYNGYYINISDMKDGTRQPGVCNMLERSTTSSSGQTNAFWLGVGNHRLYVIGVYSSMGATLEAFRTFLSNNNLVITYPLATPIEVQIDPISGIKTYYANNNIYTDVGDSQIDFRADITLFLSSLQGNRSLSASLMRSAGPEEVSEPEENIQNTEEQEGEDDAR